MKRRSLIAFTTALSIVSSIGVAPLPRTISPEPATRSLQAPPSITVHAARLLDGRGGARQNVTIEIRDSKIVAIDQRRSPYTHDLADVTLLPGLIDVHTHITHHFGSDGKLATDSETPEERAAAYQADLKATLFAGFTTVQSVGSRSDVALRDAVAKGTIIGPRILTSLAAIGGGPRESPTPPDKLRARVHQLKSDGAEVIKILASGSFRSAGAATMAQEQLDAVCDEARKLGLRTLVHAHGGEAIIRASKAGCTQIEHGVYATDEALGVMKDRGVYFDPNIGLVLQHQLENKARFTNDEDTIALMEKAVGIAAEMFKRALQAGVKMPLGTDAPAGAHGNNAREIIARVDAGQSPMEAIIGATSLAAESLGMAKTVGTLAPAYEADIIAVGGDPVGNVHALKNVVFVMRGGKVYK